MTSSKYLVSAILALGSGVTVFAANPPLDYRSLVHSDNELSQKINQDILADRRLSTRDWEGLTIMVKNGIVVLRGQVATDDALKEVKRIARQNSEHVDDAELTSEETIQREREQNCCG